MQVNIKGTENQKTKQDKIIKNLKRMTGSEINSWVDDNINNLDDVKMIIKKIIRICKLSL